MKIIPLRFKFFVMLALCCTLLMAINVPAFADEVNVAVSKSQQPLTDDEKKAIRQNKLKQLLADSKKERERIFQLTDNKFSNVSAIVEQLVDKTGLVYIGATIEPHKLTPYLKQMIAALGAEQFTRYRANQAVRDKNSFHVTLINPFELKKMTQKVKLGQRINFQLIGLGKAVAKNEKSVLAMKNKAKERQHAIHQSFFVVVKSKEGEFFRQQYGLPAKDFHITLGFNPSDVFGVDKGVNSLIHKLK